MSALTAALAGLIDYAGLFPPASVDMRTAIANYAAYAEGEHRFALGRFIVDRERLFELAAAADPNQAMPRLSVLLAPSFQKDEVPELLANATVESVEIKCEEPLTIMRLCERVPDQLERYFELSCTASCSSAIDALAAVDARAKLRLGGVVSQAFPTAEQVARTLHTLADRRVSFKATAGLHHPIRSVHPLNYSLDSPHETMHGFLNLLVASAAVWHGGSVDTAQQALLEEDPGAFQFDHSALCWRTLCFTTDQVQAVRKSFFISYGSCSFVEPLQELESLGWRIA